MALAIAWSVGPHDTALVSMHQVNEPKKWFVLGSVSPTFGALAVLIPQSKWSAACPNTTELVVQLAIGVGVVA